jgi:hypothetical protein
MAILVIGVLAVVFGLRIRTTGFGDESDIGSRAFPVLMGCLLLLGGIYEFAKSLWSSENTADLSGEVPEDSTSTVPLWKFWLVLGAIIIYLPMISYVGFFPSTVVFTCAMMRWLETGWIISLIAALIIAFVVHALFVLLFKVQLPGGVLFG